MGVPFCYQTGRVYLRQSGSGAGK